MQHWVLVCVGGAVGSGIRYLVAVGAVRWLGSDFPALCVAGMALGRLLTR